ncbi:hypothetical protein CRE_26842 [Caenorhabditis remanei]|uniref:CUT domain-containing protein n=1 Tax=Caenorhabditis remanei TaxID=31234 RepID=E3NL02_CAERE|nr:hypothetical protein CRE_26842 [Caenorhabditis remanei]
MSDSDPPTEPNRNRKRKSDSSSNTPSSSSRPPQPVPISSDVSTQSSSSITVKDVIGTLSKPLGDGNRDEDDLAAKVLTFTEEYGEKKCGDGKLEMKNPNMETSREEESHDSSNTPSSSPQPVPISSGSSAQSSSSITVDEVIGILSAPLEGRNLNMNKIAEKVLTFTKEYGEKVAASIGRIWKIVELEMENHGGVPYKDMKEAEQNTYLRLFNWLKYYENSEKKEAVLDLHQELYKRWEELDGWHWWRILNIKLDFIFQNTPSTSSRSPQPALIFYPHIKPRIPIVTLHAYNRHLFNEALRMQTEENVQQSIIQNFVTTPFTSSHTQSLGDGAPRSEPNDGTVQIVNMMKRPENIDNFYYIKYQIDHRINPPVPIKSLLLIHSPDIGMIHYIAPHNFKNHYIGQYISQASSSEILAEIWSGDYSNRLESPIPPGAKPDDPTRGRAYVTNPEFERKLQAQARQLRANQNMATANTPPAQSKLLFPFDIQGIPQMSPCPPDYIPFPGLYHDENNPVTDDIFDEYFLYLQTCFPPPRRNSFHSNDAINYDHSSGSQYSSDERFVQNAYDGHGQDRGFMMSGLVPAIPFPSAQSEPLTVEGIMKQLNRPRGDRMIVPGKILEDVHDFIIENKKARSHISQMVGKAKETLTEQMKTIAPKHYLNYNCNLQEFYLRLFNWLEYDDEKRKEVLALWKELNAPWYN